MKKTKLAAILMLAAMLLTTFCACALADEKITISVWVDYTTPERTAYLEAAVAEYMEANPNIVVELTPLPNSADDKVATAYDAGMGPDIFISSGPDITSHINGDYVIPLDEYYENWAEKDTILASAIQNVRKYDIKGNNNLYYIPNGIAVTVLWVRSDWVKEAGASVDTWENLFDAVQKMTDKANKKYGLAIRGGSGSAKFLERMMYSYSGLLSMFDENGKCTINDPKNVEFVERYLGLYNVCTAEGDIAYGWTELSAAFDSGAAGLAIHTLGSAEDHLKAFDGDLTKFEAIGMPLNALGTSVNLPLQPGGASISSTCKNPQEAFDLLTFMLTGDRVSDYARLWGVIPVDANVLETAQWLKDYPWNQMASELLMDENTLFYDQYPWLPGKDAVTSNMDANIQFVMAGEMTAQELCDEWAAGLQECYDAYFGK